LSVTRLGVVEQGPAAVSLRDLARRAGVSHAAPAHHFTDRAGLFTALAVEGYTLLAGQLATVADRPDGLLEAGTRYVEFALSHPAHFAVISNPDLYHRDRDDVLTARARAANALRTAVGARGLVGPPEVLQLAAWSMAHGFAMLWNSGSLPPAGDPVQLFRSAAIAFTGAQWPLGPA
jgi:AcrR family transcriptional regulator